jgi:hypothetical protein
MASAKNNDFNDDYADDYQTEPDYDEPTTESDSYDGDDTIQGEKVRESETFDRFFNTEEFLYSLEKTMWGFQRKDGKWVYVTKPIARTTFINYVLNSIRSLVNPINEFSDLTIDEVKFDLMEKNKEFIAMCYDESKYPNRLNDNMEALVNMHDHICEIHLKGLVEGHSGEAIRQIVSGIYKELTKMKDTKPDGIFQLGAGESNLIKIGGSK